MAVVFENKTPRGVDPRGVIFYRASYLSLSCASTEETDGVTLDDKFLCFMPASPDKIARVEIVNRMLYAASSLIEDESDCLFHILRDILSNGRRVSVHALNNCGAVRARLDHRVADALCN
jgi:hypothetical protein